MAEHRFVSGHQCVGVVLAGGCSSRMGRNKTRIRLHEPDGPDMLARSVKLLSRYCDEVLVASGSGDIPGYSCVRDRVDGRGPIAGLQAALLTTGTPILALACDLPCMDEATIQRLVCGHNQRPAHAVMTTFRRAETELIESLTAIYEPACLPLFDAAIAAGRGQISRVIPKSLRHDLVYTSAEASPFLNVNRPEDLEAARRMLGSSLEAVRHAHPAYPLLAAMRGLRMAESVPGD